MFTAHLPAGYIASKLLYPRFGAARVPFAAFLAAGLLGAIAPDFDLAWFYLVDSRYHLTVPALYKPWWLNFLMHWSMLVELAIVTAAVCVWSNRPEEERAA